jgi:hypothetical protein
MNLLVLSNAESLKGQKWCQLSLWPALVVRLDFQQA